MRKKVQTIDLREVGTAWVAKQRKSTRPTAGAKTPVWVVRSSSSPGVKPGTRVPAGSSSGRQRQVGVTKGKTTSGSAPRRRQVRRQRELEQRLDGQRLEQLEKRQVERLEKQGVDTMGCAPLNAGGAVEKSRDVSYASVVHAPPGNAAQLGVVKYRSRAQRSR